MTRFNLDFEIDRSVTRDGRAERRAEAAKPPVHASAPSVDTDALLALLEGSLIPGTREPRYSPNRALKLLGLSPNGAGALVARIDSANVDRTCTLKGRKVLAVNVIGLAQVLGRCGSPAAKALHQWADEVLALTKAPAGPRTVREPQAPPQPVAPPAQPPLSKRIAETQARIESLNDRRIELTEELRSVGDELGAAWEYLGDLKVLDARI